MNALPPQFDLSSLVGDELTQVCIGEHQIQLHFYNCSIEGAGKIESCINANTSIAFNETWNETASLNNFLGQKVASWTRLNDYQFTVNFSNQTSIKFTTETWPYECFTISLNSDPQDFYVL